jgi:CheY-like chemotaxis protein
MIVCRLYCEGCHTEAATELDPLAFAILLEKGSVGTYCRTCAAPTEWKVKLPPRDDQARPPRRDPKQPVRVLAVDDDPDTLRILKRILNASDCRAVTASSPDQVMAELQQQDFDVLLCDIRMPGISGPNLFRFLAMFLPEYVGKTVFLTGDRSEETIAFLEETGCPYTFKPIDMEELRLRIAQVA